MASVTSETPQNKQISVIIPVFNRERTLPRLFTSLEKVSYQPLEVIFIDNGSQDSSLALCQRFADDSRRNAGVSVLVDSETRPGACACRNKGIKLSHGDYLYFFDSDDEISPDFLSQLAPYLTDYDIACAPTEMYFEDGTHRRRDCIPTAYPYDHILSASLSTQSFIIRKSFLTAIGGWDEKLSRWNDWELGVRILCQVPRLKWNTAQSFHRIYQHSQSISGKSFTEDAENLIRSLEKSAQDIAHSKLKEKIKQKSYNALSSKYLLLSSNIYKEGNHPLATEVYRRGIGLAQNRRFRLAAPLLYHLAKHGVPGTWRLFRVIL